MLDKLLEILTKIPYGKIISMALLIIGCLITIKIILKLFDRLIAKSTLDQIVCKILRIAVKALLLFVALIVVLGSLGVAVSSLVAALSVVGVAFSLAIQGFLSNVFGGIQIISNKPFTIGDFVEAGGQSGTVREVGLFYTKLDTADKKLIQIPNSAIANSNITNYSSAINRRVEILVSASYDDDIEKVRQVLLDLANAHELVLQEEKLKPVAHVKEYGPNDISYVLRVWTKNSDYWTVHFDLMDTIKPTFDKNGISMSFPHVNVHMV